MINNSLFRAIFDLSKNLEGIQEQDNFYMGPDFSTITIQDFEAQSIFEYIDQYESTLKFFLRSKDQKQTRLALDSLLTINKKSEEETLLQILKDNPNLTWYGANRFNEKEEMDKNWDDLQDLLFFIPKIELFSDSSKSILKINIDSDLLNKPSLLAEYFFDLLNSIQTQVKLTSTSNININNIVQRQELPSFEDWTKMIALAQQKPKELKKVILSRREEIYCQNDVDLNLIAHSLLQANLENSFFLYFKFSKDSTFISVTPETLFKARNDDVTIDSIAGTIKRSSDKEEDRKLAQTLLSDPKEVKEHEIVTSNILASLSKVTDSARIEFNKKILKLNHIQHIHTKICAKVKSEDSVKLINLLHPTAAIGGEPKDEALEFILENEDRARGLYASPIGFISNDEALFIVGIRSCLVKNKKIELFGGCGIVKESLPQNEWLETKIKMNNFRGILENSLF